MVFRLLLLLFLTSVALLTLAVRDNWLTNQALLEKSRQAAISAVTKNVHLIEERISGLEVAREIARDIGSGALKVTDLEDRFDSFLEQDDGVSITVAWRPEFRPHELDAVPEGAVYFKSAVQIDRQFSIMNGAYSDAQVADLTHGDISSWYRQAMNDGRPVWISSPYRSPVSQAWWACGYRVPFFLDGEVAGVVAAELTLEQAGRLIFLSESQAFEGLPLEASFGMLIASNGTIFSHPDHTVVQRGQQIGDLLPGIGLPAEMAVQLPQLEQAGDEPGAVSIYELENFTDERTGQVLSVFFAPISDTQWWTAVVLDTLALHRSMGHPEQIKAGAWRVVISSLVCALFLILLLCRVDRGMQAYLWPASILVTVLCISGIAWILGHSFAHTEYFHPGEVVLKNPAIPAKVLMKHENEMGVATARVPTGIFVQSAEFSTANDVTITGFVWQDYHGQMPEWLRRKPEDIEPGFIFPESEDTTIEYRYQQPTENGFTLGWYFRAVLRQEFDYGRYPFDQENVWIRMWHSEIGRNVALVPDLASYSTLIPNQFPGLELQDFVLEGWSIAGTYFSYRPNNYNTDFGIDGYSGGQAFPELYFNIALTRSFLNAFIMNFITLTVSAFLLYAVLYTVRRRKEERGLMGFNVSGVLGFCAALFFVVILAHTSLRESLAAPRLVYIEYYFFVMYAAFLGVSINAILVASEEPHPWVSLKDNLLARLLFWPLLSAALLLVTLVVFY